MSDDLSDVQLHLVDSVEAATRFMTWMSERRPMDALAVDTETGELPGRPTKDALSPWHGRIRMVQVGDGEQGWAIPWEDWRGVFLEAMNRFDGDIICHNAAFEAKYFALHSPWTLPWERTHDTMIQAQIIDPLGPGGLKPLAARLVDGRAVAMQSTLDTEMTKAGWSWGNVPIEFPPYWTYAALDTILTYRLHEILHTPNCAPGRPYHTAYDMEMAVRRVVTMMELNGARVDLEYSQQKYDELNDFAEKTARFYNDQYSVPGNRVSVSSNIQLVRLLQSMGVEITEFTPTGLPKADKDQLKKVVRDYPGEAAELADAVLNMRKASKLATTYFDNFLTGHIDGLVHPSVKTLGARTGRMSVTGPALQTLPKSDKVVRKAFIPRDVENEVILSCDLEQVEFRLLASMADDPQLNKLFADADAAAAAGDPNGDTFTYIMRDLYGDPSATKKDKRRGLVKSQIYGALYGAGIAKQALTAGVSETVMKQVADAFNASYPGITAFTRKVEDIGMRRFRAEGTAYVHTALGRRLPADERRVYALVNYLIQGGAAEVFKLDLLKLDAAGLTDMMVVPVHDEIVMSVPKEDAADIGRVVQECMTTRAEQWSVPLLAGTPEIGPNWGELS
jgi:DNA polymerase I